MFRFVQIGAFGTNYGLKTANETVTRCLNVALRYFGPFPAKRLLEVIDTLVFFSANLAFQNTPDTIVVQRIGIRRFWWPLCAGNEARNLGWRVLSPVGMSKVCGQNVCVL